MPCGIDTARFEQEFLILIAACAYYTGARAIFCLSLEPIHRRVAHDVELRVQQRHPFLDLAAGQRQVAQFIGAQAGFGNRGLRAALQQFFSHLTLERLKYHLCQGWRSHLRTLVDVRLLTSTLRPLISNIDSLKEYI